MVKIGDGGVQRQGLTIGNALRAGNAVASCRQGFCAGPGNCPGAARVPDVDQDQGISGHMKVTKALYLVGHSDSFSSNFSFISSP